MKNYKAQLLMGAACVIIGFLITVQIKYVNIANGSPNSKRAKELKKEIETLTKEKDSLQKKMGETEKKLDEKEKEAADKNLSFAAQKDEADRLRRLANTTEVKGDGIIVTINEADPLHPDRRVSVDYRDIRIAIINELNSAHAEAISINGERFTSSTAVIYGGTDIKINGNPFDPYKSFKIQAIGNPDNLNNALTILGGAVDQLKQRDISIKITKEKNLTITGSKTTLK